MKEETQIPYVVSGDTRTLLREWTGRMGLPDVSKFLGRARRDLSEQLRNATGSEVVFVDDEIVTNGMGHKQSQLSTPVISMDRIYVDPRNVSSFAGHLDITRAVDFKFNDIGLRPRVGARDIGQQIDQLAHSVKGFGCKEVVIADDVVFGGGVLLMLQKHWEEEE